MFNNFNDNYLVISLSLYLIAVLIVELRLRSSIRRHKKHINSQDDAIDKLFKVLKEGQDIIHEYQKVTEDQRDCNIKILKKEQANDKFILVQNSEIAELDIVIEKQEIWITDLNLRIFNLENPRK